MFAFLIILAIEAALYVVGKLIQPHPRKPRADIPDVKPPTVEQGRPIPVPFGTVRLPTNAFWWGNVRSIGLKNVGPGAFSYGFDYAGAIAMGPCDVLDVVFDTKSAVQYSRRRTYTDSTGKIITDLHPVVLFNDPTSSPPPPDNPGIGNPFPILAATYPFGLKRIEIDAQSLFGGETQAGGINNVYMDIFLGTAAQAPSAALGTCIGRSMGGAPVLQPNYPHLCYVVAYGWFGSDKSGYYGTSPTPHQASFVVRRCPNALSTALGHPEYAILGTYDCNPIEAIYDILTSASFASLQALLQINPAAIDVAAFKAACQQVYTEAQLGTNPGVPVPTLPGNIGNGFFVNVAGGLSAPVEKITVVLTSAGGVGSTFTVTGSVSGAIGTGTVGTPFVSAIVSFTLEVGSVNFAIGDTWTFTTSIIAGAGVSFSVGDGDAVAAEETLKQLLAIVDGIVYTDQETALFTIKLARADYVLANQPLVDETVWRDLQYSEGSWPDTYNEVSVRFRDRGPDNTQPVEWAGDAWSGKQGAATVQNIAALQANGGIPQLASPLDYAEVSNGLAAAVIAQRGLRIVSTPRGKASWKQNRTAHAFVPGEVVRLSAARFQLGQKAMRITSVVGGSLEAGTVEIHAEADVYATALPIFPSASFTGSGSAGGGSGGGVPVSVTITPATYTLPVSSTVTFVASATQGGVPIADTFVYTSSVPGVATINSSTGVATGVALGTTIITATDPAGNSATATLTVAALAPTTVVIAPLTATVAVGGTVTFVATARDQNGNPIADTFTYTSATPGVATINSSTGVATGVAPGTSVITATDSGSRSATATITVVAAAGRTVTITPPSASVPVGGTVTFVASEADQSGNPIADTFTYTSSNEAVATVNSSTGVATGVSPGAATITATGLTGLTATAQLTVVTPGYYLALPVGSSVSATVSALAGSGAGVASASIRMRFKVDQLLAAAATSGGLLVIKSPGGAVSMDVGYSTDGAGHLTLYSTINGGAVDGGPGGTILQSALPAVGTFVTIVIGYITPPAGGVVQSAMQLVNDSLTVIGGASYTQGGVLGNLPVGNTTVVLGLSSTRAAAGLSIDGAELIVSTAGSAINFAQAIPSTADANVVAIWTYDAQTLAGIVGPTQAISTGTPVYVPGGIWGTVAGGGGAPTPTTVVVTPAAATIAIGTTLAMAAQAKDQNGANIADTFTWSSSVPAVVTVNASTGVVTAVANGTTVITASDGTISGTATITVGAVTGGTGPGAMLVLQGAPGGSAFVYGDIPGLMGPLTSVGYKMRFLVDPLLGLGVGGVQAFGLISDPIKSNFALGVIADCTIAGQFNLYTTVYNTAGPTSGVVLQSALPPAGSFLVLFAWYDSGAGSTFLLTDDVGTVYASWSSSVASGSIPGGGTYGWHRLYIGTNAGNYGPGSTGGTSTQTLTVDGIETFALVSMPVGAAQYNVPTNQPDGGCVDLHSFDAQTLAPDNDKNSNPIGVTLTLVQGSISYVAGGLWINLPVTTPPGGVGGGGGGGVGGGGGGVGVGSGGPGTVAWNNDFIGAISMTMHLDRAPLATSQTDLAGIGCKVYRAGGTAQSAVLTAINALAASGIKGILIASPNDGWSSPQQWINAMYPVRNSILGVEAPNESDIFATSYRGYTGPAAAVRWNADMKVALQAAGPPFSTMWLLAPSVARFATPAVISREIANQGLGDITAICTHLNMHYYSGGQLPTNQLDRVIADLRGQTGASALPMICTETGYNTKVGGLQANQPGVSLLAAAKYLPREVLEMWNRGVKIASIYDLWPPDGNAYQFWSIAGTGSTLLPAYYSFQNLCTILADGAGSFSPTNLSYSLTGAPSTLTQTLLQHSSGAWYLLLSLNVSCYDTSADRDLTQSASVGLVLPSSVTTIQQYTPRVSTTPTTVASGVSTATLVVTEEIKIFKITP